MNENLYFRLIQYIDALFDDGRLTKEDLQRLAGYVTKLGNVRDRASKAELTESEDKSRIRRRPELLRQTRIADTPVA